MALIAQCGLSGDSLLSFTYYIPAAVIDRSTQLSSSCQNTMIKNKIKFSSYIRRFRMERLQSHIWLTASSFLVKYLRVSSYYRKLFLINDFATDPIWIFLYMRKISFSFLSVHEAWKGCPLKLPSQYKSSLPVFPSSAGHIGRRSGPILYGLQPLWSSPVQEQFAKIPFQDISPAHN